MFSVWGSVSIALNPSLAIPEIAPAPAFHAGQQFPYVPSASQSSLNEKRKATDQGGPSLLYEQRFP